MAKSRWEETALRKKGHFSGTRRQYLARRIVDLRPDLVADLASGQKTIKSWRSLAIELGILHVPDKDDVALERLMTAWAKADEESRGIFLYLIEDWEELPARRPGPKALISEGAPEVLVQLRDKMPMSDLAKALGVSRETVRRWCAAETEPRAKHITAMQAIADGGQ